MGEIAIGHLGEDHEAVSLVQRFSDTRGRQVAYTLTATTRFAGLLRRKGGARKTRPGARLEPRGVMPGSVVVTGIYKGTEHTFARGKTSAPMTAPGRCSASPRAGSSPARGLPLRSSLSRSPDRAWKATTRAIPAWSGPFPARPGQQHPTCSTPCRRGLSAGPALHADVLESARVGGVLRVYLRRPWWSSGGGEQLGVVLADANGSSVSPYYTQWGADPLWKAYSLTSTGAPTTANFP